MHYHVAYVIQAEVLFALFLICLEQLEQLTLIDCKKRLYLLRPELFMPELRPVESLSLRKGFQYVLYEAVPSFGGADDITACARLYDAGLRLAHFAIVRRVFDKKVVRHFYQDLKQLESQHSPENRAASRFVVHSADVEADVVERIFRAFVKLV